MTNRLNHINSRLIQLFSFIRNRPLLSGILSMLWGTGFSFAITLATAPIITRLYDPSSYGSFGLFMSIASIIGSVSCLQYNKAIVISEKDEDVINTAALCFFTTTGWVILIILAIALVNSQIDRLIDSTHYSSWLPFIPLIAMGNGISFISRGLLIKNGDFNTISIGVIIETVMSRATAIGYPLFSSAGPMGLVLATVFGLVFRGCFYIKRTLNYVFDKIKMVSLRGAWEVAVRHKKFPIYMNTSGLVFMLNEAIPIWLLSRNYTMEHVGCYALVHRLLLVPNRVIAEAISQPFFQQLSTVVHDREKARRLTMGALKRLTPLSVLLYGVIALTSKELFPIVFGSQWQLAGEAACMLALYMCVKFITKSISMIFSVYNLQNIELILQLLMLCASFACFGLFAKLMSFTEVLFIYSVVSATINIAVYLFTCVNLFSVRS